MIVDLFIPCFIDQIYPQAAQSMVKVLEKLGVDVHYNVEQTCCGQPAFNAGYWDHTKAVAKKFINDFSNDRYIVSPSASCVGMVKNYYPELFHNSVLHNECKQVQKNIYEFSDFLVHVLNVTDVGTTLQGVGTYHDSCSALRELGIREEPRKLLRSVRGLELREIQDTDVCCGFGGSFSVKFEPVAVAMGEQKVEQAIATGAEFLISTDLSCLMHMEGYIKKNNSPLKIMHLADVLASGI